MRGSSCQFLKLTDNEVGVDTDLLRFMDSFTEVLNSQRERERERERERGGQADRERETETEANRQTDRQKDREVCAPPPLPHLYLGSRKSVILLCYRGANFFISMMMMVVVVVIMMMIMMMINSRLGG